MIDPDKPLELDDGTPVTALAGDNHVVTVSLPEGRGPRRGEDSKFRLWNYSIVTGELIGREGEPGWHTVRNVSPVLRADLRLRRKRRIGL